MVSTQIQLDDDHARALTELAAQRGVSTEELIREAIRRMLDESEEARKWERALAAAGRFHSGHTDISVEHDAYLAEDLR